MDAAQILVIILAAALALLLLLAIVLVIYLIKIAIQIKRVTATAERAADRLDNMASAVEKAAIPALIARMVGEFVQRIVERRRKADDK